MKETKVYVDKLPESCRTCPCSNDCMDYGFSCNITLKPISKKIYYDEKLKDCPLIDIKDHDRELVKEVCNSIMDVCKLNIRTYKKHLPEDCQKYKEVDAFNKAILGVLEFLDKIEKEYE